MSALPKAVRKQIAEADRIAKEYYTPSDAPPPPPPEGDGVPSVPPVAAPPADVVVAPPPGDPPAPPTEGWEQKYKVLQGKYNAEVPRLQVRSREQDESIRNLQQQLTATQNLLASLSAQQASAPAANATPASPAAPVRLVKDEEVREFGPDLIDVMRRVVREEHASLLPEIDRRVQPAMQRADQAAQTAASVGQRVERNDKQSVFDQLTGAVPTWQELNVNPEFLAWLDEVDPFAGVARGTLLQQAYKAHDGPRVVKFFSGYLKEHAAVTPPAPPSDPAAPAAPAAPQRTLDQFVAPGAPRTGAASTQDGSGKRVWSRAEITKFYNDVQQGRYRGRAEEQKKLEADIFKAQREERIR